MDIQNFASRARALLAGQFQDQPTPSTYTNLQKLINAVCVSATNVQTQIQNLINNRSLATAVGKQLDGLGQILGLARIIGQSDESYREDLQFQVFLNASSGTPEQVIAAALHLTGADKIWYIDSFPAAYILQSDAPAANYPANPGDLIAPLQALSPGGVEFSALIATYNTLPFAFASDASNDPLHVVPSEVDLGIAVQLELNTGEFLYVCGSSFGNPQFGGTFGEFGFTNYQSPGAGQMTEAIQV